MTVLILDRIYATYNTNAPDKLFFAMYRGVYDTYKNVLVWYLVGLATVETENGKVKESRGDRAENSV